METVASLNFSKEETPMIAVSGDIVIYKIIKIRLNLEEF